MKYYYIDYIDNGQKRGPISADQLRALAQLGIINRDTVVIAGEHEMKACEIDGLTFDLPPAEPKRKSLTERIEEKAAEARSRPVSALTRTIAAAFWLVIAIMFVIVIVCAIICGF